MSCHEYAAAIALNGLDGPHIGDTRPGFNGPGGVAIVFNISTLALPELDPWIGFSVLVPLGSDNEDSGFGIKFEPDPKNGRVKLAAHHRINMNLNTARALVEKTYTTSLGLCYTYRRAFLY
ncbi:hypothetical protein B0H67DRAFT_611173 [Lasiosphaeris hirsuta]|uniref:Uncharacterized protein n=1 Tax=Lasiosphaeris hirsuta TaxID=260670 RepID=A0AA40A822_9PEZI|nr:hypothetical protein B0H67DRAFT_611173 [Lasiosphaeris hirsuta]